MSPRYMLLVQMLIIHAYQGGRILLERERERRGVNTEDEFEHQHEHQYSRVSYDPRLPMKDLFELFRIAPVIDDRLYVPRTICSFVVRRSRQSQSITCSGDHSGPNGESCMRGPAKPRLEIFLPVPITQPLLLTINSPAVSSFSVDHLTQSLHEPSRSR